MDEEYDTKVKPRFTHDCENCLFLGTYSAGNRYYDLYYHPSRGVCDKGIDSTVIARYGEEGYNYSSGLLSAQQTLKNMKEQEYIEKVSHIYALRVARLLAVDLGVLDLATNVWTKDEAKK